MKLPKIGNFIDDVLELSCRIADTVWFQLITILAVVFIIAVSGAGLCVWILHTPRAAWKGGK